MSPLRRGKLAERFVAENRGAVHYATMRQIISVGKVLRQSVIPKR